MSDAGDPLLGRGRSAAPTAEPVGPGRGEWVDDWADEGWEGEYWDEVPDDERLPRQGNRLKWVLFSVLAVVLLAAAVAGGAVLWVLRQIDPPGEPGEAVLVTVDPGATVTEIADQLQERGIVTNAEVFRRYLQWKDVPAFRSGTYSVEPRAPMGDVVKALQTPPEDVQYKVTFPEGYDLPRVAARLQDKVPDLSAERFLAAAQNGEVRSRFQPEGVATLEGLLFPDTYQVAGRQDELAVLERMVRQMESVAERAGIDESVERVGLNQYEVLIVASLIEKEAKTEGDRAKIARVIYNRLAEGMPLQIDATVIYALGGNVERLTQDMIQTTESPYNTYKIAALPPTPIALPGRASIEAALNPEPNPAEGPWLYYVVIDDQGNHAFAQTYDQHLANIRRAEQAGVR